MSNTSRVSQISSGMSRQSSPHQRGTASHSRSGHHRSSAAQVHRSSTRASQTTLSNATSSSHRHTELKSRSTHVLQSTPPHRSERNLHSSSAAAPTSNVLVPSSSTGRSSYRPHPHSSSTSRTTTNMLVRSGSTGRSSYRPHSQSSSTGRTTNSTGQTTNNMLVRSSSTGRSTNREHPHSSSASGTTHNAVVRSRSTGRTTHYVHREERQQPSSISRSSNKEHWSHPGCTLKWVNHSKPMYSCNGCRMDGLGMRYRCDKHDFDLHKECVSAQPHKRIVFQGYKCTFFKRPHSSTSTFCDACGFQVNGFVFHSDGGKDFHPKCAKLESNIHIENIKYKLHPALPSNCHWCNMTRAPGADKEIPGWAYVSNTGSGFHVNCVFRMAMQVRRTEGDSTLTFRPNTGRDESSIGINSQLIEKLGIVGLKILLSTLLGHFGGVVHVIDLLSS